MEASAMNDSKELAPEILDQRIFRRRKATIIRLLVLALLPSLACAQELYQALKDPQSPAEIAYTRYFTKDRFGRKITFYINGDQRQTLPIVVSVLGSGAFSNFIRRDDRILDGHRTPRELFGQRAHILIVEKPGVDFLEQHPNSGTAVDGSPEFRRQHTLERWAEAISAAVRAARTLPLADKSKCLLIGHSEGGLTVARVAAENPFVTHVATLAGSGPTQLYDFLESARNGALYDSLPPDPAAQVSRLLADVAAIYSDPDNPDKFFFGHPYPRWSSYLEASTTDELSKTHARIFIGRGTAEGAIAIQSFDVLYATLLSRKKDVTARLVVGADHAFQFRDQPKRDGWNEIYEAVRDWFFR
jgi:dienelactone hydrolase